jgi:CHAD domain-containing protein
MSYELRANEALADGIRRIYRSEICKAIEIAAGTRHTHDTPVHETRKCLKKARAALRLVRKEIGRGLFRQQDHWLRDVGRLISDVRDAEVRLATVKELQAVDSKRGRASYRRLEEMLTLELENFLAAFAEWQSQAIPILERARDCGDTWALHHFNSRQLRRAVQTTYKRARWCLAEARRTTSPETFHDFRTEAKVLFYQLRILRPTTPVVLKNLAEELKAVGDLLGRAHDLAFLGDRLRREDRNSGWQKEVHRLLAVLEVSQTDLHQSAADLAERFFVERPRDFGARLDAWLHQWTAARSASIGEALLH